MYIPNTITIRQSINELNDIEKLETEVESTRGSEYVRRTELSSLIITKISN